MKGRYDVAVIGAGPVGSYTAYQLADHGLNTCLIDKKKKI
jgi:flavin-dependent dehydrogenase